MHASQATDIFVFNNLLTGMMLLVLFTFLFLPATMELSNNACLMEVVLKLN